MKTRMVWVLALMVLVTTPLSAQAWDAYAGWVKSDIGLANNGDGFTFGLGRTWSTSTSWLETAVAVEYIQKNGSYMRNFVNSEQGDYTGESKLRVHVLQPSFFVNARLPLAPVEPRFYLGLSYAMHLSQEWTNPDGTNRHRYSYENQDYVGHVGLRIPMSEVFLDIRYTVGFGTVLIDHLVDIEGDKAADQGLDTIDVNSKTSCFQIMAGLTF